jgi:hypothetical protein
VTDQIGKARLEGFHRIQLVSAREEYLPLELFYDLPPPRLDAGLCPHGLASLKDGVGVLNGTGCSHCRQQAKTPADHVCPLGFWCMRYVIERHAIDPNQPPDLQGDDFALQSVPLPGRDKLPVLSSALYAASDRVDSVAAGQVQRIFQALDQATQQHAIQVDTWPDWEAAIKDQKPSLLVLLPHTSKEQTYNLLQMEIGHGENLIGTYVTEAYIKSPDSEQSPVVLLLGCETLAPEVPFRSFTAQFRRKGAAVVLSTLTPVLGRHAGPVAERLVQDLGEAAENNRSFGDAMLSLRRRALADGVVMVLCLVAQGDAQWQLESVERS